jgi:hypothetical protein
MKTSVAKHFFILNEFDKPCVELIARRVGDQLRYINHDNGDTLFNMRCATDLETFGFRAEIKGMTDTGKIAVKFEQEDQSRALYPKGKKRNWQDRTEFMLYL